MSLIIDDKFDVATFLAQFNTDELEAFKVEVEADIKRRKTNDKEVREVVLLEALNDCVLPEGNLKKALHLNKKRKQNQLNDNELEDFLALAQEEETLRLKRVRILGELAQIKNMSLPQLTEALGIKPLVDA